MKAGGQVSSSRSANLATPDSPSAKIPNSTWFRSEPLASVAAASVCRFRAPAWRGISHPGMSASTSGGGGDVEAFPGSCGRWKSRAGRVSASVPCCTGKVVKWPCTGLCAQHRLRRVVNRSSAALPGPFPAAWRHVHAVMMRSTGWGPWPGLRQVLNKSSSKPSRG